MKVVEALSEDYPVALLNSKNSWRILGQESFSYEIAQDFEYDVGDSPSSCPIGNAGNITAVMSGFLKFFEAGLIRRHCRRSSASRAGTPTRSTGTTANRPNGAASCR